MYFSTIVWWHLKYISASWINIFPARNENIKCLQLIISEVLNFIADSYQIFWNEILLHNINKNGDHFKFCKWWWWQARHSTPSWQCSKIFSLLCRYWQEVKRIFISTLHIFIYLELRCAVSGASQPHTDTMKNYLYYIYILNSSFESFWT